MTQIQKKLREGSSGPEIRTRGEFQSLSLSPSGNVSTAIFSPRSRSQLTQLSRFGGFLQCVPLTLTESASGSSRQILVKTQSPKMAEEKEPAGTQHYCGIFSK